MCACGVLAGILPQSHCSLLPLAKESWPPTLALQLPGANKSSAWEALRERSSPDLLGPTYTAGATGKPGGLEVRVPIGPTAHLPLSPSVPLLTKAHHAMHLCSKAVCGNGGGSVGLKAQRQPVSNAPGSLIVPLHRHPTLPRNTLLVSTTHHRAPCVHASTGAGAAAPLPDPRGPAPNASPVSPTPTSPDASSSSKPDGAPAAAAGAAAAASSGAAEVTENKGLLQRAKEWVFGSKFDKDKLAGKPARRQGCAV